MNFKVLNQKLVATLPDKMPVDILNQYAELYATESGGKLEGVVSSITSWESGQNQPVRVHTLYVSVPGLAGFMYRMLSLQHSMMAPYPVDLYADSASLDMEQDYKCNSEEELKFRIEKALGNVDTQKTLAYFIKQVDEIEARRK